jgi:hypothetical protein
MNLAISQPAARQFKEATPEHPSNFTFCTSCLSLPVYKETQTNEPLKLLSIPPQIRNRSQKGQLKFELKGKDGEGGVCYRDRHGCLGLHTDSLPPYSGPSPDSTSRHTSSRSSAQSMKKTFFVLAAEEEPDVSLGHLTLNNWYA